MEFVLCRWYNDTLRGYVVNQNTGNMRRMFVASDITAVPDKYKAISLHCLVNMDQPKPKDSLYVRTLPLQLYQCKGLATAYHVAKIPTPE